MNLTGLLLIAPVLVPLLGAALTAMLYGRPRAQRLAMEASVGLMALASLLLFVTVQREGAVVMTFGGWPRPFGISFVGDALAAPLSLVTALIGVAGAIYARAEVAARRRRAGFDALFLGLLAAVNGAFLTGDLFNLYVWFELMLLTALGLITLDRRKAQIDGAIRYAAISMLGATFILIGIAFVVAEAGTLDLADLAARTRTTDPSLSLVTGGVLMLAGFMLKAGLFPFFFWLPASYHTAPVAASAVFAGLLTKAGFYAALRVLISLFGVRMLPGFSEIIAVMACCTMLICVAGALAQTDLRRLFAFHIIAQVGYMAMGLSIATAAGVQAAIFYMIHSIIVQTNLFFAAGAIARADGSFDLRTAGGIARSQPLLAMMVAVPILSLSGIPPLSGFWAKFTVIDAAFEAGRGWLAIIAILAGLLTIISMGAVWALGFWQSRIGGRIARPVPTAMLIAIGLLSCATVLIGLLPGLIWDVAGAATQALGVAA
ncbi:proton-conducting transporter membrane subunit [Sphingomonas sp. C3-2]|uniref:proton-conducting transporter transmembrane domain-containing protein n=1 Tax=Sphingomonas sp. C3-2 TaxID=3062169 RepID=UPI00294AF3E6|nr:proton-conducting transporter membrane subunit [Sphingomonas sp. C3-2]WOK35296.1 proton-conducting transporter membrane subunit [Sphingomonas sp. C3-2]